jgi:hypothetical protein
MADYKMPYKGRMTIRAGSSEDKRNGRENKRVRAWEFDPKPGSTIAKLETVFLGALSSVDSVIAKRDDATKSGKFTADGISSDVLQFALNHAVPALKRGRDAIASAKQEAAALREKTKLREPDTTDQWKVGLMLRAVDRFAAMTQKQRDALTRNPEALDPIEAEALVTAPASLTGVSKMHRQQLIDRALEAQHGEKIAELKELERAIEAAESAVTAGRDEVRLESGVYDPHKFDELAAPIEQKANAPWLRKRKLLGESNEQIYVVDRDRRVERPATPEEIENGVYAEDFDTYQKLTGQAA